MGRLLIALGIAFVIAGVAVLVLERAGLGLGRLPGDIHIERGSWSFYFPLATCLVISIVLTLLFSLFGRR